ncbi:uncharacterized protein [Centruroides vittatus]|uniref:uncharacterized protein n=1 Tax=Centruroides vittatus TaxID=120091 RepID=UPI00351018AD
MQAFKKLSDNEYENDFEMLRWIMNYLLSEKLESALKISVVKRLTYNQMLKCIKPCLCYVIFTDFGRYYSREEKKFKFPRLGFSSRSNEDVIETFYSTIINEVVPVLKLIKASKINKSLNRLHTCVFLEAGSEDKDIELLWKTEHTKLIKPNFTPTDVILVNELYYKLHLVMDCLRKTTILKLCYDAEELIFDHSLYLNENSNHFSKDEDECMFDMSL